MIEKKCYFFNVGFMFDKDNKKDLKECWNCNGNCCKSDLCNGLWCEDYGIDFNREGVIELIKEHVEESGAGGFGYIKSIDIKLPKEVWHNIFKKLIDNYNYDSIQDAKINGFIPYEFVDIIGDYSSYWEEPDISFMKVNNKIVKNQLHILKENELNSDTINWINKELYGIEKDDIEMGV